MDKHHLLSIVGFYREKFRDINLVRNGSSAEHAMWMCHKLVDLVHRGEVEKANRWLGFIQGVLYCDGWFTLDEIRDHNKSLESLLESSACERR